MKKLGLLATVMAAITFSSVPAMAGVTVKKTETFSIGTTSIEWTSSFVADSFDIIDGLDIVLLPLEWTVVPTVGPAPDLEITGFADFVGVSLAKKFGSKGVTGHLVFPPSNINDLSNATGHPDTGNLPHSIDFSGLNGQMVNETFSIEVPIHFHGLKCGGGLVGKGKVHLKLFLNIDAVDGDDVPETVTGYGFNANVKISGATCL